MIYFGYCELCNYADASTSRRDIYDTISEHQEKAHGHVEGERIRILVSRFPFKYWLMAKKSIDFWRIWRNRNIPKFPSLKFP